jgi:hypothetical protein
VDSIERSLTGGDDCADILILLANVRDGSTASWPKLDICVTVVALTIMPILSRAKRRKANLTGKFGTDLQD